MNATTSMKTHLGITEIAVITGKERSTVFRWIKSGKLGKVRKIGGEYQVPHESFVKWWNETMKTTRNQGG
jgi:excisionase family DNA binding protein